MNEFIQEYVDSRGVGMRVDRQGGVIRGVKILGLRSRNGRTYLPETLSEAAPLYEDAKVNVHHPKGKICGPRDYQDRIGVIRNVVVRPGDGLFADFHFNPKHSLAEQLAWDAEHAPENVGFSHNVEARVGRRGDQVVVEAITKVQSVDLVADPATTRGLFESNSDSVEQGSAEERHGDEPVIFAELTVQRLKEHRPDLVEALKEEATSETARLQAETDRLTAATALLESELAVRRLLSEFKLPNPDSSEGCNGSIVSRRFMDTLLKAPNEEAMREMVEDRARLVHGLRGKEGHPCDGKCKPLCREQGQVFGASVADAKSFVEGIT